MEFKGTGCPVRFLRGMRIMIRGLQRGWTIGWLGFLVFSGVPGGQVRAEAPAFVPKVVPAREPAIPLVAHDPYFSIWSMADRLTDDETRHWTREAQPLTSLVRIDGKVFRLMGAAPKEIEPFPQTDVQVRPTTTQYRFSDGAVQIELQFLTPALPTDLELLARPVTYITWRAASADGQPHDVSVAFAASGLLSVHEPGQKIQVARGPDNHRVQSVHVGTVDQPVLARRGDFTRIDWGQLIIASGDQYTAVTGCDFPSLVESFSAAGALPPRFMSEPQPASATGPVLAALLPLGKVEAESVEKTILIAYDDLYAIDYMDQWLKPYWARSGQTIDQVLDTAWIDAEAVLRRCQTFDQMLGSELDRMGGPLYSRIGALAHRQSLAGGKLVADSRGMPLYFSKENTSNGCIGTIDVIYPQFPHLVWLNPVLAKASVVPLLEYGASKRWKFPFAPHDLGTYPAATGQVYGGGERTEENQMPVEESGNMLLMAAAIAQIERSPDFVKPYWPQLTQWARYCEEQGFDPANQLCTDDFAGHLARNANLSIKAILGLAAYGKLAAMRGESEVAERSTRVARELACKWMTMADAGDHYQLTFDPGDTWSQKYNLVWDQSLDLKIFPAEVATKELAYYAGKLQPLGLPLDSRKLFTKTDWQLWTASMAPDRAGFERLIAPIGRFLDETPDRVPFCDFYWTDSGKSSGMHARPVIGGVFIRPLTDKPTWEAWASKAPVQKGEWAPIPVAPTYRTLVPTAREANTTWLYTTENPGANWTSSEARTGWKEGHAGFGTRETPGAEVRTVWDTPDIWIRRSFTVPGTTTGEIRLRIHHDEDAEVYLNNQLVARLSGFSTDYQQVRLSPEAQKAISHTGENVLAIHCHQTRGGQFIDAGLVEIEASVPAASGTAKPAGH